MDKLKDSRVKVAEMRIPTVGIYSLYVRDLVDLPFVRSHHYGTICPLGS